jgi:hypothetical protein
VLEVEPEEGGAMDYREMRGRRRGGHDAQDVTDDAADGESGASDTDDT